MTESSSAWKAAIAAGAVVTATYLVLRRKDKDTTCRRAKYACSCGQVEADLLVPAFSYRYIEMPSMQCCCDDCIDFCRKVLESGNAKLPNFLSPGVDNIVFQNSEIRLVKGSNHIKSMKLTEKSGNRRIYSLCCGTPLGIEILGIGTTLLYRPNIVPCPLLELNETNMPDLPPTVCLYHDKVKTVHEGFDDSDILVIPGTFAPRVIAKYVSRMLLLLVLGEKGPGEGFPVVGEVEIGLDSIPGKAS